MGSPETVTRKLSEMIDRLSPGYLHIYGNEGAMDHTDVMRSIELLGKEVIPAIHEIQLKPYESKGKAGAPGAGSGAAGLAP